MDKVYLVTGFRESVRCQYCFKREYCRTDREEKEEKIYEKCETQHYHFVGELTLILFGIFSSLKEAEEAYMALELPEGIWAIEVGQVAPKYYIPDAKRVREQ